MNGFPPNGFPLNTPGNFPYGGFHPAPALSQGYPPTPLYMTHDVYGRAAPPGYAFSGATGELVALPAEVQPTAAQDMSGWNESMSNPAYIAMAQGKATIEQGPNGPVMVPKAEYIGSEDPNKPTQDQGTLSFAVFDAPASPARTNWRESTMMSGVLQVPTPLPETSPLFVTPTGTITTAPFGGGVALGVFDYSHLGGKFRVNVDMNPGTTVKVPVVGSQGVTGGRLIPMYWAHSDDGVAHVRTYLLFPGGPVLTNDAFTDPPPNIIQLQGTGNGTLLNPDNGSDGKVAFLGWWGKGTTPTPSITALPTRTFRGSVKAPAGGAANVWLSRIPVPRGAIACIVVGGFFSNATVPQTIAITGWTQNTLLAGNPSGPFAPNTTNPVPLLTDIQSIDVFAGIGLAAADTEVPFSATFFINV